MSSREILNSWKEIADYVGRGIRTVQRWERQFHLPVRRPAGKSRSAVVAFTDELDVWLAAMPTVNEPVRTASSDVSMMNCRERLRHSASRNRRLLSATRDLLVRHNILCLALRSRMEKLRKLRGRAA